MPPQGGRKHPNQEFIQINTENILFICGGAFDGLEKIIEKRKGNNTVGFQGEIRKRDEKRANGILRDVIPHDLIKFGLIPELVGRLPIIVTLDELDNDALVKIISEPKNSLLRQYIKLFQMDGVELHFDEAALRAVADLAIARKTGARGLRSILEGLMTELMFEIPSRRDVEAVRITEGCVKGTEKPQLIFRSAV